MRFKIFLFVMLSCMVWIVGAAGPATPVAAQTPSPAPQLFPYTAWLYSAPMGAGVSIAYLNPTVQINTHAQGFDYPIAYTDENEGSTSFTDANGDVTTVPNPIGGYYPSYGGWGADDGHLVVVDTVQNVYYDFWKLYADGNGNPASTNVGALAEGSNDGIGIPGTTAAGVTGAAGDLMPGDLQNPNGIGHALTCVVPSAWMNTQVGTQFPAVKTDGVGNGAISEGGKLGIDPSTDIADMSVGAGTRAILYALKWYGCAVVDQTSGNAISIYSDLPNLNNIDLTGLDQVGPLLKFYM